MFQGMEYVYQVYKDKSFSKAAANLFISQPSLSANVKRVEKKVGFPIFDRSTKPLSLTECGKEYIRCVEEILAVEKGFSQFVYDFDNLEKERGTASTRCSSLNNLLSKTAESRVVLSKIKSTIPFCFLIYLFIHFLFPPLYP